MKRQYAYLAALCACAAVTAIFCAAALADPGSGNGNSASAPGQQKQEQTAPAPAPAPAAQPAAQPAQTPPGQAKKAEQAPAPAASTSPEPAKQAAKASSASPGVKPANSTTHWTHCTTGSSASGATCTSSDSGHTPQAKTDVSKQYGNGKTAAQIAVSRGGVNVQLTGPGNSQPHKVSVCGKPNNPSGGVDVHAVKSYNPAACAPALAAPQVMQTQTSVCGQTTITTTSTEVVGVLHGKSPHLMTNVHSAHFTKHADQKVTATSVQTQVVPTGESCSSSNQQTQQVQQAQQAQQSSSSTSNTSSSTSSTQSSTSSQTSVAAAVAPATPSASSGVAGVQATFAKPKAKSAPKHGVLGTVTRVTGGTLPFTGFPVWLAMLVAAGLILGGVALRRRPFAARS